MKKQNKICKLTFVKNVLTELETTQLGQVIGGSSSNHQTDPPPFIGTWDDLLQN